MGITAPGVHNPSDGATIPTAWGDAVNDDLTELDLRVPEGAWTTFTPSLGAETTNPTLGTGSVAEGAYIIIGKTFHARFKFQWGTGGTAGEGDFTVVLPTALNMVTPAAYVIGSGSCYYGGADHRNAENRIFQVVVAQASGPPVCTLFIDTSLGAYHHVRNDNPWVWGTSGMIIQGYLTGELA